MAAAVFTAAWILSNVFILIHSASLEETSPNSTTTIPIPTRDLVLHLILSPASSEDIYQQHIAKVFYKLLPVTDMADSLIFQEGISIKVQSRDDHIASVEEPTQITLYPSPNTTDSFNYSVIYIKGNFLGRTVLEFFIPNTHAAIAGNVGQSAPALSGVSAENGLDTHGKNTQSHTHYTPQNTTDVAYTQTVVHIPIEAEESQESWVKLPSEYYVSVIRQERIVDHLFIGVIVIIIVLANVGMGCKIDLKVIKEVIRRPIPPGIGLFCQYITMPLLSFALIKLLQLKGGVALGMFATGCAPGGGASNMYTYLLKGDVSLSVTMTFISTMSALGLIPFWLFTLGKVILSTEDSRRIRIPYANIIYSLLAILVPVGVGILIEHFKPIWSKRIRRTLRPVFIFFIIFIFTFGVYVNLFIFKLFTTPLVIAGILLPYVGFLTGGLLAFLCRQSWERIRTIAVETGIQNTGVAYLVLTFTLPQPEADLSMVSPIIVATFTPIPLMIAIAIIEYRHRCLNKSEVDRELQSPITDEPTFDQTAKVKTIENGSQEKSDELKQNNSAHEHLLIDNSHSQRPTDT